MERKYRTFGQNLRAERLRRDITQEELARRLKLRRQAQISKHEIGDVLPDPETILRYAKAIGCEPRVLLRDVLSPHERIKKGLPLLVVKKAKKARKKKATVIKISSHRPHHRRRRVDPKRHPSPFRRSA